jgi:hypothetical protein
LNAWSCGQNSDRQQENKENQNDSTDNQSQTYQSQPQASEVNDKEVKQFALAVQQIQLINQHSQKEMIAIVEQGGLSVERFREMQQAQQDSSVNVEANEKELKQFAIATVQIEKIQIQTEMQMQEKIKETGLTENRYQEIYLALQNDPELLEKLREFQQQIIDN